MHEEYIRLVPGSSFAVLAVHGIAGTPDHFRELIPLIPEDWSVCNLLLPGHGQGVREFGASAMRRWKDCVSQMLEKLLETHSHVLILAHSMGTLFAIREAIGHPDRVRGLFLLNCPLRVKYPPSSMLLSLRAALGSRDPAAEAMRRDTSIRLTPWLWCYLGWIPRFMELLKEIREVRGLLPGLTTPAICFHSCRDELVSGKTLNILAQYPKIQIHRLEASGHFAYTPEDMSLLKSAFAQWLAEGKK